VCYNDDDIIKTCIVKTEERKEGPICIYRRLSLTYLNMKTFSVIKYYSVYIVATP